MRKSLKKIAALSMTAVLSLASLAGCSSNDAPQLKVKDTKYEITDNSEVLFDMGKSTITYGEMMYFVAYFEMLGEYQKAYYQSAMGYTGDFWNEVDENGNTEAANYKNNSFQEAHYVEVMKNAAIDAGVILSEEELADIEKSTNEALNIYTEEQRVKANITYEGFYSAQKTMAYSTKYVEMLRNEYLQSDTYKKALEAIPKEENLAYAVNFAYVGLAGDNAEDTKTKYTSVFEDVSRRVAAGEEFTDIQNSYKDDTSITFGFRVIKRNDEDMDKKVMEALSKLENEQSSSIVETDYGMFVFQMLDNEDESEYQKIVTEQSDKILESMITAKYSEHNSDYSIEANEKLIESIEMGKMTIISK